MRSILLSVIMLTGCASVSTSFPSTSSHNCGKIEELTVSLADGVETWPSLLTCPKALEYVEAEQSKWKLQGQWSIIFTAGNLYYFNDTRMAFTSAKGLTRPLDLTISVRADSPWVLDHEFGHAHDVENGIPNHRD